MRGNQVLQAAHVQLSEQCRCRIVGKVAQAPGNALLQETRVTPVGQHLFIVIALKHQCRAARQHVNDMWRRFSNIGQDTQLYCTIVERVLNGLSRIVRNGKWKQFEVTDRELLATIDQFHTNPLCRLQTGDTRAISEINRPAETNRATPDTTDMIAMLMSDYNGIDVLMRQPQAG